MDVYEPPKFFNQPVGGKPQLNIQQTQHQLDILNTPQHKEKRDMSLLSQNTRRANTTKISNTPEINIENLNTPKDTTYTGLCGSTAYDPIADWENSQGLTHKARSRLTVHHLHVDSRNRQKDDIITIGEYYTLTTNPIESIVLNNKIFIAHNNHPFEVGDKIVIDGVAPINNQLLFTPVVPYSSSMDPTAQLLTFNCIIYGKTDQYQYSYIQVNYPHNIPQEYSDSSYLANLYCEIQNFTNVQTGSTSTDKYNAQFYGNVPLTFVNNVHSFFLAKTIATTSSTVASDVVLTYSPNHFYIELPYQFTAAPGTPSTYSCYIKLLFYYINGLPINQINAKYPTDIYHGSTYQVITQTTTNGYYININSVALASGLFGGSNVQIGAVADYQGGYIEPNQYSITLEKTYKNIVKVKLNSTEFPNSEYVIKNYPPESANNKLYWQNYDDGSYVYSISITPGKYTPTSLTTAITEAFYNTPRQYYPPVTQNYTNHNYITLNISTDSDTTTFSSYRESVLKRAIQDIYYINASGTFTPITQKIDDPIYTYLYPLFVVVNYPYHGLTLNTTYQTPSTLYVPDGTSGDSVLVSGTYTFMGVPGTILDGQFEAYAINSGMAAYTTRDYFMYILPAFDIGQFSSRDGALHGGIFKVYAPNKLRLLFNTGDTLGSILGFPDVGKSYAITQYAKVITNKDPYQPDINPVRSADTTTPGNAIALSGHNYIMMICDQFPVMDSIGKIKSAFAKINLVGIPGKLVYNTFVSTPQDYYEPINEITDLSFSFYTPEGDLYDFNGLDHSFTLEIVTLDDLPQDTNINPHTGRIIT